MSRAPSHPVTHATTMARALVWLFFWTSFWGPSPAAFGQIGASMASGDDDLFYLDQEDYEGDDLFDPAEATATVPPRALLLEPAGLSVLPVLSYGAGFLQELKPWLGADWTNLSLRARYARGSATMGQIYAVTELSTLEVLWAAKPWLYVGAGPAYRNIRATLKDDEPSLGTSSTSVAGLGFVIGIARPLGTYLLGCDVAGAMLPFGKARRRGPRPSDLDDRNPHVDTLDEAGEGRSVSVLRLYFGPRF